MPLLHDQSTFDSIAARVASLTPSSQRQWGSMSVDQMLWHVNQGLLTTLGELTTKPFNPLPLPGFLLKFVVLKMPWPKGVPTAPEFLAKSTHDFAAERAKTLELLRRIKERPLNSTWPPNQAFGQMSGREWSQLGAKHLDHHLRQFGC